LFDDHYNRTTLNTSSGLSNASKKHEKNRIGFGERSQKFGWIHSTRRTRCTTCGLLSSKMNYVFYKKELFFIFIAVCKSFV